MRLIWLALVHRDLETMDYAVGSLPIKAASAGASHRVGVGKKSSTDPVGAMVERSKGANRQSANPNQDDR